jgi:hypothetical protein
VSESYSGEPSELVDIDEASVILGVTPDRVRVMVEDGLIVPAESGGEPRFRRAELVAVRELGG